MATIRLPSNHHHQLKQISHERGCHASDSIKKSYNEFGIRKKQRFIFIFDIEVTIVQSHSRKAIVPNSNKAEERTWVP